MIPLGEYLPDLPDHDNPGATQVLNVLPAARSYLPWPAAVAFSNALTADCRGAITAKAKDGTVYSYAGDVAALYSMADAAWSNVSLGGGADAYTLATEETWEFAKWGEQIIAVSGVNTTTAVPGTNDPQVITMGGANFADLGGTPPQARHIGIARDFVVLGNTWDSGDGLVPNRVRWSGKGDATTWTVSAATQADKEDLAGGNWVQRIIGGEYGVVFLESSVWRMSYVGSPVVWQFDEVLPFRGTPAPGSVAQAGDRIFFLSQDGFEVLEHGSTLRSIGAQRVDRTFYNDFDASYFYRLTSAIDPYNRRVFWSYPGSGHSGGQPNKVLCYDWSSDRWALSEQATQLLFASATTRYTMDGLDAINTDLDAIVESLDARIWMGGTPQIGVFDSDNKLAFWSGSALAGIVETTEIEAAPGQRAMLSSARPIVDGGVTTVQIGHRNRQQDALIWTAARNVNANGRATIRKNARYHRVRLNVSGAFTHAEGVDVDTSPAGRR